MVLIGLFALILLWAQPASAEPISLSLLAAVGLPAISGSILAGITTFVLTFAATTALSFVASALFKQPARSGGATGGGSAPTIDNKVTIRQAAAARPIIYGEARAAGVYAFIHATDNNQNLRLVILFAGHEVEDFTEIWFNDAAVDIDWGSAGQVTSGPFAYKANVTKHLGAPDQLADQDLIDVTGGLWTATDRLQGIAYLYVTLNFDAKVYTAGVPNITAVIKGKNDIYDPRTDTTGWSPNSALCTANYLCDATYGVPVDYAGGIDEDYLIAAANACDEDGIDADAAEVRYRTDGVLQSSAQPQAIIGQLLGAMHGRVPYDGERWRIIAGVYQTPVLVFTDDDLRAGPRIQTLTSRRDIFNAVKGTFIGPANAWQEADFPPVKSALYKAQDGDQEIWKDMALPLTRTAARSQRIAKIDLLKTRQPITAAMPGKLTLWTAAAGDTIGWTSARYGWTAKAFEVGRCRFAVYSNGGNPTLGIDLELRETAAAVYSHLTSEESSVDPAPNTDFPSALAALPPSNLTATERLYEARPGVRAAAKVVLAWQASPDAFVISGGGYLAEYRLAGSGDWVPLHQTAALTIDIPDIEPGIYDFRVSAVNWAGNASDPLTIMARQIAGLGAAPSPPANLTLIPNGNFVVARWDTPEDLDVELSGNIIFRHASQLTGAGWADGVTISKPLPASLTKAELPLVAGTYMAKFRDASGIWSDGFASFATGQVGQLAFTTLTGGSLVEDPAFAGAKTNCTALLGGLRLGGAGLFSDIPLLSAVPSVVYYGGVRESGTYDWSTPIDLGAAQRGRLTVNMTSLSINVFDLVSQRTGNVSTWPRFGGSVFGAESDAHTEVRFTQDDPNGMSPVWTAWARLDVGEFFARGIDLRTQLSRTDASFDRRISALAAIAEEVV